MIICSIMFCMEDRFPEHTVQMLQSCVERYKKGLEERKKNGADERTIRYFETCIKEYEFQIALLKETIAEGKMAIPDDPPGQEPTYEAFDS
jgi:hypothetical protein